MVPGPIGSKELNQIVNCIKPKPLTRNKVTEGQYLLCISHVTIITNSVLWPRFQSLTLGYDHGLWTLHLDDA